MRHLFATSLLIAIGGLVSGGCSALRAPAPGQPLVPEKTSAAAATGAAQGQSANDRTADRASEAAVPTAPQRPPAAGFDASRYPELERVLENTPPALVPLVVQDIIEKLEQQGAPADTAATEPTQANSATVVRPRGESSRRPPQAAYRIRGEQNDPAANVEPRTVPAAKFEPAGTNGAESGDAAAQTQPESSDPELNRRRWTEHLAETIDSLEKELPEDGELGGEGDARQQALLRMLYVIAGDRANAARPIDELDESEREFWLQLLHGLSVYMNDEDLPLADRRATLALQHLRNAADQLASASSLEVRNLAFCTRVDSYGRFTEFKKYEFRADQEVLLYVEVDNFTADPAGSRGEYETALQGSYHIYDASGKRVAEHTFPLEKEVCRNRRRDFFIPFRAYVPKVPPGQYRLQLTVEDVHGEKFGQAPMLDFTVVR